MSISKQSRSIITGFSIVLILMLVLIIIGLNHMHIMQSNLDSITQQHNVKTALMEKMREGIFNRQISLRNMMLMPNPFDRDEESIVFRKHALSVLLSRDKLTKMDLTQEENNVMIQITDAMREGYNFQQEVLRQVIFSEKPEQFQSLLGEAFLKQTTIVNLINSMKEILVSETDNAVNEARQSYRDAKNAMFILGGFAITLGIIITVFIVRFTDSQTRKVDQTMKKLRESHDMLEQRVEERTRELAIARDEALASNKSKNAFLANMSHELRTPMNAIIGYSELLEDEAIEYEHDYLTPDLKKIQGSAKHLLSLINGLLDLSKIDAGKIDLDPVEFDIPVLINEVQSTISPLLIGNNNKLLVTCPDNIGNLYTDNMRLRQILINLLSNATKFTHDGTISLKVERYMSISGTGISFSVSDTGIGISDEYMDRLFDDFSQADSSTTRNYGGTGLGLTISRRLCKLMNGEISVKSKLGEGATFTVSLPTSRHDDDVEFSNVATRN